MPSLPQGDSKVKPSNTKVPLPTKTNETFENQLNSMDCDSSRATSKALELRVAPVDFALTVAKAEARVDSRLLARHLGNQHKGVVALIDRYADRFRAFGQLLFQKEVGDRQHGGGNPERFALLNEDHAFFLLALSRNSERVIDLKAKLVQAFREARRAADLRQVEYLPTYHRMHDRMRDLAAGSSNERFVHLNLNKLINKACGLESGQRRRANLPQQSMVIVAQAVATNALQGATDHRAGYRRAKDALQMLSSLTPLELGEDRHG